jgi:hypothetical protein
MVLAHFDEEKLLAWRGGAVESAHDPDLESETAARAAEQNGGESAACDWDRHDSPDCCVCRGLPDLGWLLHCQLAFRSVI